MESHSHDNLTLNDTDHVLHTVDVTIQRPGYVIPADGNIWVSFDQTLTDVNTQTTGNGLTRDSDDQIEFDDSAIVESHSHDDLTLNDNDHVPHTVDATIRRPGYMTPVDGNVHVSSDRTLTDASTQTTDIGLARDLNTGHGLLPVDGDIQVTGNNGVQIPLSVPKGIAKITKLTLELFDNNYNLYAQKNKPSRGRFIY